MISSLIHPDQVGFIHHRYSADNIRRFLNIMRSVRDESSPMAALFLDAEKAFDRVEWQYLLLTLESFGFGRTFIKWIGLLYKEPKAAVVTNGTISPCFRLGRGTRQGCPLSPLLFTLALEPLAAAIRLDPNFPGIQIGPSRHKLMLYADGILLYVSDPELLGLDEKPLLDRAHRTLRSRPREGEPPRPFVIRVHFFHVRNDMLKRSGDASPLLYKGRRVSIFPDYTTAVAKKRASFGDVKRQLRACPGVKYGLIYPAVLRLTLPDSSTHRFEDPAVAADFIKNRVKKAVMPPPGL
ncbi:hypothetical protein AAFF_G00031440 [Aldrovandia affinis]|uniref:Reverse transcriptase domain-containing protein n=1 Tax=Aldrovandia affinis TaxID=143900 RepID=A0AAD7R2A4_9TELE|nr:hypothetical protein AAFF_G00031440 [Aldrovandia affinis]